ncbi:MAG TPA: gamma-glutamylcyclotransferase [Burkholderiales bacterium]|nr:gamma-glutamylcyclotransferase [Burkholderiales bacterium]
MELERFLERLPRRDLWVFGYGSLMWSPGFRYTEKSVGLLRGYHRALCILSTRYRGTARRPGLVMGLCRGGSCWGIAFRIPAARVRGVLAALWRREMIRKVYEPRLVPVRIRRGFRVRALTFVAEREHPQFVRELDLHGRAQLVAQGVGQRGPCTEYIRRTLEHMYALGVTDPHLARVLETAEAIRTSAVARRAR